MASADATDSWGKMDGKKGREGENFPYDVGPRTASGIT